MMIVELVCIGVAVLTFALVKRHYWFLGESKKQIEIVKNKKYTNSYEIFQDVANNILTPEQGTEILVKLEKDGAVK